MQDQISAIQKIMNKPKPIKNINLAHFSAGEKCNAIFRWQQASNVNFDLSFVESVNDSFIQFGRCTDNQISALDNIIKKYKIDLDAWA